MSFRLLLLAALCVLPSFAAAGLEQIEHMVFFMQENRAFDHYYGMLAGVRGFNDRTSMILPSGRNSFYQPINVSNDDYMLPFPVHSLTTNAVCMNSPEMDFPADTGIHNEGRCDAWNTARAAGMGMAHWEREDLPYYYSLYDNFLVGDQYFQSTLTQTNPNRLHFFSGSNGLSVGKKAILDNVEPTPGWEWITMAEVLEAANVSWRVYQEVDNFDDNAFAWFKAFNLSVPGSALYEKGIRPVDNIVAAFEHDLAQNTLPSVSWLIAAEPLSEHASNHPPAGEDLSARLLARLAAHPEMYAKTLFVLNYDEGGQFFDHHWVPTPPVNAPADGVSTADVQGEVIDSPFKPGKRVPIGLGFRVPLVLVSPWTRGNLVYSEVLDHTSMLRLVEKRFNVTCPNISPWRRTVTGDVTNAFDFEHPDYTWPQLPNTSSYVPLADWECLVNPAPTIPAQQSLPKQEAGVRRSRALPYEFLVHDSVIVSQNALQMSLSIDNSGAGGAPFVLVDQLNGAANPPRKYALHSGKTIHDTFDVGTATAAYSQSLHGPNGFVREFNGVGVVPVSVSLAYHAAASAVKLQLHNLNIPIAVEFEISDMAYNTAGLPKRVSLNPGQHVTVPVDVSNSGNWYDLQVTLVSDALSFQRRFMGRMETGADSISDPAMSAAVPARRGVEPVQHPLLPHHLTHMQIAEARLNKASVAEQAHLQKDAIVYPLKQEL